MPLIIPRELPAYRALSDENVFVMHRERAHSQDIRPLRILILNLMPTKIVTETQLARLLANSPLQVQLTFLQTATHSTTHTPPEHMKAFYKTFDAVKHERFDGLIITGAPVEDMDYEQVDYWDELCTIMEYSKENVFSTIHLCWGNRADIDACGALRILAESDVAGPMLLSTESGRQIFVIGHPEYDKYTLDAEYKRDVAAGRDIRVPVNYYPDDDPGREPLFRWRAHGYLLYANWLNYYVYQNTPYDLDRLEALDK